MREAHDVVSEALTAAHALWQDRGLTTMFSELVNTVWTKNVDRHEPVSSATTPGPWDTCAHEISGTAPCAAATALITTRPTGRSRVW